MNANRKKSLKKGKPLNCNRIVFFSFISDTYVRLCETEDVLRLAANSSKFQASIAVKQLQVFGNSALPLFLGYKFLRVQDLILGRVDKKCEDYLCALSSSHVALERCTLSFTTAMQNCSECFFMALATRYDCMRGVQSLFEL